ncbi:MAG: hypothetical protein U9Q69_00690 [Nanoarchaeota archaeon]|nr:hypothetical protein [Nanoarchaeota archaeon]
MKNQKEKLKHIIERLTQKSRSIFADKVFLEAGEFGIGEIHVQEIINELKDENFISQPIQGIIKKVI